MREDLRDRVVHRAALLCVVNHPVGDMEGVRQREAGRRRHEPFRQGAGNRDQLERGARLVRVGHRAVALQIAGSRREPVRVVARLHGHCEDGARARIEHDRAGALRVPLLNGLTQDLFRVCLHAVIEGEEDVPSGNLRFLVLDVDDASTRVLDDGLLTRVS